MTSLKITKIIIEGPDCSGKSTLVERLKNVLRWDSKYLRHKEGDQFGRYLREYAGEETVLDRSHFSENVYSKMWRGGSPFTKEEKEVLDKAAAVNSLIIFAIPSLKTLKERYQSRGFEQQITLEELSYSRKLFLEEIRGLPIIIYRAKSYGELEKLLNKVKKMVK